MKWRLCIYIGLFFFTANYAQENDLSKILDEKRAHHYDKSCKCNIVQKQLEAYNSRDLETFLSFFSDSSEGYIFPDILVGKGKEEQRIEFTKLFANAPNLHAEIKERICFGDYVIDHEVVTGMPGGKTVEAVEIYKVEENLITKVWFIFK